MHGSNGGGDRDRPTPPPPRIIQTNEIHIGKLQKLGLGTPSPLPRQTKLLHNPPSLDK